MKLGPIEVTPRGVPASHGNRPVVPVLVEAGWYRNEVNVTPTQARELAAQLQLAADVAEGGAL